MSICIGALVHAILMADNFQHVIQQYSIQCKQYIIYNWQITSNNIFHIKTGHCFYVKEIYTKPSKTIFCHLEKENKQKKFSPEVVFENDEDRGFWSGSYYFKVFNVIKVLQLDLKETG